MYKKYWIIGICVFVLTFILCLIFLFPPKFDLKNGNINLKYGESYREPGFKVTRFGKDYTSNVKVSGKVNDKKVGKYKVTYSVKIGLINFKSVRTVNVFDNEKPVIKLDGYLESYVCPSKEYEEEGFSASDNYDGDLTKKVKVTKKDNEVIYTVKDSSNNKTTVKRKLIFQDKEAPVLELSGSKNITLSLGETFKEFGYTANDDCDGDLQSKVSVSNNIDTSKKGNYEVIRDLSFEVRDEEFVCVIGPSGCGKSTLLKMFAGFEKPTGGEILYNGKPVTGIGYERAMVFQEDAVFPWLKVRDNVEYGLKVRKVDPKTRKERVDHFIDVVGLK